METIRIINFIIAAIFIVCYSYQFIFVPISLWMQHREKKAAKNAPAANDSSEENLKRYAVLICARNEENVIGSDIQSPPVSLGGDGGQPLSVGGNTSETA